MNFGQVLAATMERQELTQTETGKRINLSNSQVCKITKGVRPAPRSVISAAAKELDDPMLYFSAMNEVTGGAFVPWLNNVDLHPAAVALKVLEEVEEAVVAIKAAPLFKRPEQLTPVDREQIDLMMEEVREKVHAGMMLMAAMCYTHGYSWSEQWKAHTNQVKAKNYVR